MYAYTHISHSELSKMSMTYFPSGIKDVGGHEEPSRPPGPPTNHKHVWQHGMWERVLLSITTDAMNSRSWYVQLRRSGSAALAFQCSVGAGILSQGRGQALIPKARTAVPFGTAVGEVGPRRKSGPGPKVRKNRCSHEFEQTPMPVNH